MIDGAWVANIDTLAEAKDRARKLVPASSPVPGRNFYEVKLGDRVTVINEKTGESNGRTGTIVGDLIRHNGYRVEWDAPQFGVTDSRVPAAMLRAIDNDNPNGGDNS
jgi:hypothetical protein